MDVIMQLQEQVNTIATLAFNIFGTLQRDAAPFDALVNALPQDEGGEEARLKRTAQLQVLFTGSLLKNNKALHEALIAAMQKMATVLECIQTIETG